MSGTRATGHWAASLRRRLGLDANPVRRRTDRAETWFRIWMLVFFMIAAPITSIGFTHWTDASMTSQAQAQTAREHLVTATLLTQAAGNSRFPAAGTAISWAVARWTAPDSTRWAGQVQALAGARKGSTVRVWTDTHGRLAAAPVARSQIVSRLITVAALTPLALALLLLTITGLVHRALERRRMAAWEADWTAVEPQWTHRLR